MKNRLKEIILGLKAKDEKMTQKELAKKVGMDEARLSRFLRMDDTKLVNIEVLEALYKNFNLTPNDVLFVVEDETE